MDTTQLKNNFTQLSTDFQTLANGFATFKDDVTKKLNQLIANSDSPADIQNVQDITAGLATVDTGIQSLNTQIQQLDAGLNPPPTSAPNPTPGPAPTPTSGA